MDKEDIDYRVALIYNKESGEYINKQRNEGKSYKHL